MILYLFHAFNKCLRAFHEQALYQSLLVLLWIRQVDSQASGSLYFCKRYRKEVSKQVNNIIRQFYEYHRGKVPRVIGLGIKYICVCLHPSKSVCVCVYVCSVCVCTVDPSTMRRLWAPTPYTVRNLHITFDLPQT